MGYVSPLPAEEGSVHAFISELALPARARNALLRAGIVTLEEAIEWSDRDLLSLPNFGPASVASLRAHIGRPPENGRP